MCRAMLFFFLVIVSGLLAPMVATADSGCSPEPCGNLTISSPFGIVSGPGENRCAHFGFQVHCSTDGIPYLGYNDRGYRLQILVIFYGNHSLRVSDINKLRDLDGSSHKGCHVPRANTVTKIGPPFSVSTLNRNLIFYNCTRAPAPWTAGLTETACRNNTFVRVGGRYNETGGVDSSYALDGCSTTTMPVMSLSGEAHASDYERLIGNGFLLTWDQSPLPTFISGKLTDPS
ncbi:uncharacterized protein [Aegilops tauschii subsp. strangulata]|uniref:uncharacterized protein n=1 Tax=Aegilops tauschii subsp. strangulata TaxID=200361 RepID=UPI003CC8C5AE